MLNARYQTRRILLRHARDPSGKTDPGKKPKWRGMDVGSKVRIAENIGTHVSLVHNRTKSAKPQSAFSRAAASRR